MPLYTSHVSATSNVTGNTDDTLIELTAASGSGLRIKRVEVQQTTVASDDRILIKLLRNSTAGATGTVTGAGPVKVDSGSRASSATATIKNGTTAFSVGTTTDTILRAAANGRAPWIWQAASPSEEIFIAGGAFFAVVVQCDQASKVIQASVVWED